MLLNIGIMEILIGLTECITTGLNDVWLFINPRAVDVDNFSRVLQQRLIDQFIQIGILL